MSILKGLRVLFICLLCMGIVSGCTGEPKTDIDFYITWEPGSGRGDAIQNIINKYNESQDQVHVTLIGGAEDKALYLSYIEGQKADVMAVPYRFIRDTEIAAGLLPMSEIDDDVAMDISRYYDNLIQMASKDGQLLGIPWIGHSMAIVYNKTLLDSLAIDPTQWASRDDMLQAVHRVTDESDVAGIGLVGQDHHDITWMIPQFIYGFGGVLVEENAEGHTAIAIDSQASKEALDYYINQLGPYAQEGWTTHTGVEVLEAFGKGQVAMEIQGPWAVSDIWKKGNPFDIGVIPLSQIGLYSEVGPIMLSVPTTTASPGAAMDFIHYMTDIKALNMIMEGEYMPKYDAYFPFRVPIRKDMADAGFIDRYPEFYPFIQGFEYPSISTPDNLWASIQGSVVSGAFHRAANNEITIDEALREIEQCDPTF